MPNPAEILASLSRIAHEGAGLAIVWHALAVVALAALLGGWRPAKRSAAAGLVVLLASVSALAWLHAGYFNAALTSVIALGLGAIALHLPREPLGPGPIWSQVAGSAMLAFGWFYPHFLDDQPWPWYLFYAGFGALRLEVRMDFILGAGSTLLALGALLPRELGWAGAALGFSPARARAMPDRNAGGSPPRTAASAPAPPSARSPLDSSPAHRGRPLGGR